MEEAVSPVQISHVSLYRHSWQERAPPAFAGYWPRAEGVMPPPMRSIMLGLSELRRSQARHGYDSVELSETLMTSWESMRLLKVKVLLAKLSPAFALKSLPSVVALKTQKVTKTFLHQAPDKLQERQQFICLNQETRELNDQLLLQQVMLVLNQAYLDSEGTYFWQAYICEKDQSTQMADG